MRINNLLPPNVQYLISAFRGRVRKANKMWLYRDLVNWTVPLIMQSLLLSTGYRLRGLNISKNNEMRDRHFGESRCFVIGNGPSLKNMDLSKLRDEYTIGANSFYMHKDATESGLDYLCIGDATFMEDRENNVKWHKIIEEKLPDTKLVFNPVARPFLTKYNLYSNHSIYYYWRGVSVRNASAVNFDFCKPLNNGVNTGTLLSIPLAIYLGFKEVVLLGFDANWLDNFEGSYHFYNKHDLHPNFDSSSKDDRWPRYEDHLINALRDFISHRLICQKADQLGVNVVNATVGGRLDMYPRVDFDDCV